MANQTTRFVAIPETTSTSTGRASARPARRRRSKLTRNLELALLLTPALLLFCIFVLGPIIAAAYYSLFKWSGFGSLDDFAGFDNYIRAFKNEVFRHSIWNNILIAVLSLVIQLPLSLGIALLLNRNIKGRAVLRLVVFAPYVLSEAITSVVWSLLLQPDGAVNKIMENVGLGGLTQQWLADKNLVMYVLFVVCTWKYIGFGIILLLAGLQSIPPELKEAGAVDGATPWQITRRITLPLLGPTIRVWIFLSMIGSLQLFDLVWITTRGGPGDASQTMVSYLVDRGMVRYEYGYGSAVSVIVFIICFTFAALYQRFALRRDIDGAMTGKRR